MGMAICYSYYFSKAIRTIQRIHKAVQYARTSNLHRLQGIFGGKRIVGRMHAESTYENNDTNLPHIPCTVEPIQVEQVTLYAH